MADLEKVFSVRIEGLQESAVNTEALAETLNKLRDAESEESRQRAASNQLLKEARTYINQEEIARNAATGSIKQMGAELSIMRRQYDELSKAEREDEQVGGELLRRIQELDAEFKTAKESTGRFQESVGSYQQAIERALAPHTSLKGELKDLQAAMAEMLARGVDPANEQYQEMAQRAGEVKDALADAAAEVNRFANDTRAMSDVVDVAQTGVAAFGVYQGALQMFGIQSESATEAVAKLQGAMAVLNSVQKLNETLTNKSSIVYKAYHRLLRAVGVDSKTTAAATTALGGAMTADAAATTTATVATGAFKKALISTGIGAIVVAVGSLVAVLMDLFENMELSTETTEKLSDAWDKVTEVLMGVGNVVLTAIIAPFKDAVATFQLLKAGLSGEDLSQAWATYKNQVIENHNIIQAYTEGAAKQEVKNEKEKSKQKLELEAKELLETIKDNEAKYGSDWKYCDEGLKLYREYWNKRIALAAEGSEQEQREAQRGLDSFEFDVKQHTASVAKSNASMARSAASSAKSAAKSAADTRKQAIENAKKFIDETRKTRVDYEKEVHLMEMENAKTAVERVRALHSLEKDILEQRDIELEALLKQYQKEYNEVVKYDKKKAEELGEAYEMRKKIIQEKAQEEIDEYTKAQIEWSKASKYDVLAGIAEVTTSGSTELIKRIQTTLAVIDEDISDYTDSYTRAIKKTEGKIFPSKAVKKAGEEYIRQLETVKKNIVTQVGSLMDGDLFTNIILKYGDIQPEVTALLDSQMKAIVDGFQQTLKTYVDGMDVSEVVDGFVCKFKEEFKTVEGVFDGIMNANSLDFTAYQSHQETIEKLSQTYQELIGKTAGLTSEEVDELEVLEKTIANIKEEIKARKEKGESTELFEQNLQALSNQYEALQKKVSGLTDAEQDLLFKTIELIRTEKDAQENYKDGAELYVQAQKDKKESIKTLIEQLTALLKKYSEVTKQESDIVSKTKATWSDWSQAVLGFVNDTMSAIKDAMGDIFDMQIEEIEKNIDEVSEKLDEVVEKKQESDNRLKELDALAKDATGGRAQAYEEQIAREMQANQALAAQEKKLAKEKEKLEAEKAKKERQAKKAELISNLVMGISNGALAVINALKTQPFIPLGLAAAATASIMTALQTGIISAQISKLEDGGLLVGKRHSEGGIPVGNSGIEVEGGEYVINRQSTAANLGLIEALNNARGKVTLDDVLNAMRVDVNAVSRQRKLKYESGGVIPSVSTSGSSDGILKAIKNINMTPVVAVTDIIDTTNQLNQVRVLSGIE